MFTITIKDALIAILLIALIVLVIYVIVLVSNLTDTVKKANFIMDSSTDAVTGVVNNVSGKVDAAKAKTAVVGEYASKGLDVASRVTGKFIKK